MTTNTHHRNRHRKRKATALPYYRVQHTRPLGQTPQVRACLQNEGLWELVTSELREIYYCRIDKKQRRRDFCAVGWPNENGGFEIRHPSYVGCIGPKGMTFIPGNPASLLIFMDFTAYLCWKYRHNKRHPAILILNHPEFLSAAKRRAAKFASVIMQTY